MNKILAILSACLLLTLSACAVYTPAGSVVIDPNGVNGDHNHSDGRFCPPGQAKKGNC